MELPMFGIQDKLFIISTHSFVLYGEIEQNPLSHLRLLCLDCIISPYLRPGSGVGGLVFIYNSFFQGGFPMIPGYRQSRLAYWGTIALSLCLAVAVWVRDREYQIYIPILASTLLIIIGLLTAQLLGNLVANHLTTRALGLLHMELDPKAFLDAFSQVPGKLKKDSRSYAIASSYLADGYAANGEFQKAVDTLCPNYAGPKGEDPALKGLYYNNLSAYYLGMEDTEKAREAMDALESLIDGTRLTKPELSKNLSQNLHLYKMKKKSLLGQPVDTEWLEDALAHAQYQLRRLEIVQVLARDAASRKDWSAARKHWATLQKEGGKTFYKSWASRQENLCKSR